MPLYEYRCECGKEYQKLRAIAKRGDPVVCDCGSQCKKLISGATVIRDYSDISYFGDPRYADARRRECGVAV